MKHKLEKKLCALEASALECLDEDDITTVTHNTDLRTTDGDQPSTDSNQPTTVGVQPTTDGGKPTNMDSSGNYNVSRKQ